jgi:hypothetical protein
MELRIEKPALVFFQEIGTTISRIFPTNEQGLAGQCCPFNVSNNVPLMAKRR